MEVWLNALAERKNRLIKSVFYEGVIFRIIMKQKKLQQYHQYSQLTSASCSD
jgi:hypothetical protein